MLQLGGEPHRPATKDALPGPAAVGGPEQATGAVGQPAVPALGRSADGKPSAAHIQVQHLGLGGHSESLARLKEFL